MSNSTKLYEFKQLGFWQLLEENRVEIPKIQRDYAQGREDKIKIRTSFLGALESALSQQPAELDFIYGDVKGDCFYPLDGQQRLTTLFLLHWYLAARENRLSDQTKERLNRFSYEIRTSSRDFCRQLITKGVPLENLNGKLSDHIRDAFWFFMAWEKDPTVRAMLTMLDAIHEKFGEYPPSWDRLTAGASPITFRYIKLEGLGLSDDLYIKMNARGKQLTPFENFKAGFEKTINEEGWDKGKSLTKGFAHLADTRWTDLFWKSAGMEQFDKAFIRFIANALATSLALGGQEGRKPKQRDEAIQQLVNDPESVAPEQYFKAAYDYLYQSLEIYAPERVIPDFSFAFWSFLKARPGFLELITLDKPTYPQRVLFFAQTAFLLGGHSTKGAAFQDWMRVVRNLVNNSTIDAADTFSGAINLVQELSAGCGAIYEYLVKHPVKSRFAAEQMKEEILKAKLILHHPENKRIIFRTEEAHFCQGRLQFAFYCIGDPPKAADFEPARLEAVCVVFEEYLSGKEISNTFRSALLTTGDHCFYRYWKSWLYAVQAPKHCLIKDTEELKDFSLNLVQQHRMKYFPSYLKELVNGLTLHSLEEVLEKFTPPPEMPSWKIKLIEQPDLLDFSQKHYLAVKEDQSCCWLLPKSRVKNTKEGMEKCLRIEN